MLGYTLASIKTVFGTKLGFFLVFAINGWFLILAKVFRNDYVAACSTAHRTATETNESSGHVHIPCSSKLTQQKSTLYWLKVL